MNSVYPRIKRGLDFVGALMALLCFAPLILSLIVVIRIRLGSGVFFCQDRPGYREKTFRLIKFRTMRNAVDKQGKPLPDEQRLDAFGLWLRSTSLDELPELWNILRGDMSFVGPRPLLVAYLERYDERQRHRHDVPPGLTGWAQINGRNAISWEERFELDLWYVQHACLALDMKILGLTLIKVLRREGISAKGEATMPEFQGKKRG